MAADSCSTPRHIAVIMDGNGRWAKARGLPRRAGHRAGAETVREAVETCQEFGVNYLTLYAFSAQNWNRPKAEIAALMLLLQQFLRTKCKDMMDKNVRFNAIGDLSALPGHIRKELDRVITQTADNTSITLTLALSYGSREEIVRATRLLAEKAASGALDPAEITEETIGSHLYTHDMPDPCLLIRTSGELRLSNFLLWQLSYSEIFISDKCWPDFRRAEFAEAINSFGKRERRYGLV